jgi:predicted ATPase/DNA-binding CsgD family transcriptional regulator
MDRFTALIEPTTPAVFRLPGSRTPIIGREEVRAGLVRPLERGERLITLVGTGGVGKTRLALAVAEDLRPAFDGRVGWVSLGELTEPDLLLDAIARALEISLKGRDPLDALVAAIGDGPALLVIDNMEHLAEASAILGTLLDRAPSLSLLVTSRLPLRLTAEREVRISPFRAPVSGTALEEHPAIRLFIERARAVDSAFEPSSVDIERIARIVAQLDFLPLAIELAAARVRHFSLEEIESLLSSSLDLLTGGPRDAPDRHRTIRGAIGWSYALLNPEEQRLFRSLSIFPGSFTLESAIQLFEENGSTRVEVIDLVSNLVDQNLVIRLNEPGPGRYVMLGSIREYGQAQLIADGEDRQVWNRFVGIVLERVTPPDRKASDNLPWLQTVEQSMDDVRAALAWLLSIRDGERALQVADALNSWWTSRGSPREGARIFQSAFALSPVVSDRLRFDAMRGYAWLLALSGSVPQALELRDELESLAQSLDDPVALVQVGQVLGALAFVEGDFEEGRRRTLQAVELAESVAILPQFKGLLFNMASLSEILGDYEQALEYHRRGIELVGWKENPGFYALHLTGMANLALRTGNPGEADRLLREVWTDIAELRNAQMLISAMTAKGEALLDFGQPLRAAYLFGAADKLIETFGRVLTEPEVAEIQVLRDRVASALPPDELARATAVGRSMSIDELTAEMLAPADATPRASREEPSLLTPRETEVVRLLVEGKTNPEIAAELFISERTVQSHVANIMAKLGVSSRTAVAARAVRESLLPT